MAVDTNRKRGKGNKAESTNDSKRFRGSTEDRTCPHCSRVFTSELGCNYHVSKYWALVLSINRFLSEPAKSEPTASASQSIRFASQSTPQMVPRAYEMPKIRG